MGNTRSRVKSQTGGSSIIIPTSTPEIMIHPPTPTCKMPENHSESMESIVATNSSDSMSSKSSRSRSRSRLKSADGMPEFIDLVVPKMWKTVFSSTHLTICLWNELVIEAEKADKEMHAASSRKRSRIQQDMGYDKMDKRAYPAMLLIKAHILKDHCRDERWAITDMPENHTELAHGKLVEKVNSTVLVYQRADIKMSWLIEVRSNKECKRVKVRIAALSYGSIACALAEKGWPDDCIASNFDGVDGTIFKELECEDHGVNRLIVEVSDDFEGYPIKEMEVDMEKIASILY
jgi:hypothetical protein